jgi:flagellar biosynthesis/type III secretory pathway M-ring protein FliF/YscJ
MSLAVLVDQDVTWERDRNAFKRVLVPPPPEKLKVIRDLVAGITGFSAERGDQLVIETLPFENTLLLEPPAVPNAVAPGKTGTPIPGLPIPLKLDQKTLRIGAGALGGVLLLAIGAFVFRRKKKKNRVPPAPTTPATLPSSDVPNSSTALAAPGQVESQIESQLAERDALQAKMDAQALNSLKLAPVITKKAEVFAKHLREKITKEPEMSAQILRSWIREEEEG